MLDDLFNRLPETPGRHLVVLSGGLDSSVLTLLLHRKFGAEQVVALSFDYGQKQSVEIERARDLTRHLGITHRIMDLRALGEVAREVSANISGTEISMPRIDEVLGDPQPITYVPFRNLIFLSMALAHAEVVKAPRVYVGLQIHDEYGYWDTTEAFVEALNRVAAQNRQTQIRIFAPFADLSKHQEIEIAKAMDVLPMLRHTLTCYDPDSLGRSCGVCPSCSERILNFAKSGVVDPISYQGEIDWKSLIARHRI